MICSKGFFYSVVLCLAASFSYPAYAQSVQSIERQSSGGNYTVICKDQGYGTVTVDNSNICSVPSSGSAQCNANWSVAAAANQVCSGFETEAVGRKKLFDEIINLYRRTSIDSTLVHKATGVNWNFDAETCLYTHRENSSTGFWNEKSVYLYDLDTQGQYNYIRSDVNRNNVTCDGLKNCVTTRTSGGLNEGRSDLPFFHVVSESLNQRIFNSYMQLISMCEREFE